MYRSIISTQKTGWDIEWEFIPEIIRIYRGNYPRVRLRRTSRRYCLNIKDMRCTKPVISGEISMKFPRFIRIFIGLCTKSCCYYENFHRLFTFLLVVDLGWGLTPTSHTLLWQSSVHLQFPHCPGFSRTVRRVRKVMTLRPFPKVMETAGWSPLPLSYQEVNFLGIFLEFSQNFLRSKFSDISKNWSRNKNKE